MRGQPALLARAIAFALVPPLGCSPTPAAAPRTEPSAAMAASAAVPAGGVDGSSGAGTEPAAKVMPDDPAATTPTTSASAGAAATPTSAASPGATSATSPGATGSATATRSDADAGHPLGAAAGERLSFLVITVDTLRPDLGYMGYERPVSPHIDRLAERSVVYERAYSISTYTGFCLPPMMASRYPSEMPRNDRHEVKYLAENVLLAERLHDGGYHTAGAASHFLFAPPLGWVDGFDRFLRAPVEGPGPAGASVDHFHSSRTVADAAIQLLSDPAITSGPFFLWIHFLDPHAIYLEHKGFSNFGSDPRALYDGEVAFTDFHVGRVLDALAASPLHERTAVVFTADHGEAFGEHGEYHHGRHIWEEIVRIPLLVFVPGAAPRRVSRRTSVVDLAPTLLELAGLPEDPGARGRSFVAELEGADLPPRPILVDQPKNPYYPLKRAFIEGDFKLHHVPETKTWMLFDLSRDPGEKNDLAATDPELLARVRHDYEDFTSTIVDVRPVPSGP
ncbi:MAG: sulfatase [Myxococcales bacterium]|nr:sulfatase [Myxococcales bacterium]